MGCKLTFERFVLIVAETRDAPADEVEPTISRSKAKTALAAPFGGPDEFVLYSDPVEQAARCCVAVIHHRPLPEDNKRVAYKCMLEMLVRYPWARLDPEPKEVSAMLDGLGDGTKAEDEFILWVRAELGLAAWLRYQLRART
jgi:prophage maintenance system killer protein